MVELRRNKTMKRMATILTLTAVIMAATPAMTNATIEAMVSGGVPLAVIVRAIKTATKIELSTGNQDYARLTKAGASTSAADEIMKAIHYREYVGIDRSPVEPAVPVAVVAKPAPVPAPMASAAPVPATPPPAPVPAPVLPPMETAQEAAVLDPGGWTKAKWGMTRSQVADLFEKATDVVDDAGKTNLGIPAYIIGGYHKFSVVFYFGKDGGLGTVHLIDMKTRVKQDGTEVSYFAVAKPSEVIFYNERHVAPWVARQAKAANAALNSAEDARVHAELNEQEVANMKDSLLADLTEKYGNPTSHVKKTDSPVEEFVWRFPTSTITLMWSHDSQTKQLDQVSIYYGLRNSSPDL
jgi:hypothetical protein